MVMTAGWRVQPALLAGLFAGRPAGGFSAVVMRQGAGVRLEQLPAVPALTSTRPFHPVTLPGPPEASRKIQTHTPTQPHASGGRRCDKSLPNKQENPPKKIHVQSASFTPVSFRRPQTGWHSTPDFECSTPHGAYLTKIKACRLFRIISLSVLKQRDAVYHNNRVGLREMLAMGH